MRFLNPVWLKNTAVAGLSMICMLPMVGAAAQPPILVLETGGSKPMPDEWIDKDTHHRVVRLTNKEGTNGSFYFHNNPFIGDKMVFYNSDREGKEICVVDLRTRKIQEITPRRKSMVGEIVDAGHHLVYYQCGDSVFSASIDDSDPDLHRNTRLVFVFPDDFKATVTTVNADGSLLAGSKTGEEEKEILRQYPEKRDFFNRIYEAHVPHTLFTIDIRTGTLKKLYSENEWLNHVQFSPTDPSLLMYCHEGPWQKVDRIWTIDVQTGATRLMHKRTVDNEIAGHEFFSPDGKTIWFDWQIPKGQTFFLGGVDVRTLQEKKYALTRDEWSIHFTISPDERFFAGDGGDSGQVAHAKDGRWIYLFRPESGGGSEGDHFVSEKLVNMKYQNYHLEPNVHFSPDGKWIIFRGNFEGTEEAYAVELKMS